MTRILIRILTHAVAAFIGFAAGIYALPIITAPPAPDAGTLSQAAAAAAWQGEFRRDLEDSDSLHWGEGKLYVSQRQISLEGSLAPGPDYRLYLSPTFVETEADFERLKGTMAEVGAVRTFDGFVVPVPGDIDPGQYSTAIVWCESFGQFITAAEYTAR